MTLAELEALVASQAPGGLLPRDWMLEQIRSVTGETGDDLADLSVEDAGDVLGRSPSTVRDYCRRELLPGAYRQQGREWRVPRSAIRAFQRREAEPARRTLTRRTSAEDCDLGSWREVHHNGEAA